MTPQAALLALTLRECSHGEGAPGNPWTFGLRSKKGWKEQRSLNKRSALSYSGNSLVYLSSFLLGQWAHETVSTKHVMARNSVWVLTSFCLSVCSTSMREDIIHAQISTPSNTFSPPFHLSFLVESCILVWAEKIVLPNFHQLYNRSKCTKMLFFCYDF